MSAVSKWFPSRSQPWGPNAQNGGISGATATLTSPAFVLAVALLLLNDWVLKPAVPSWWTGKLSDFAGLFAFPLFWSAFLPNRRPVIFALTAVGFLVWKSPLSGPPLAVWNATGIWPLTRVLDYTDWVALAILLPSYRLARPTPHPWPHAVRRGAAICAAGIAFLAFTGTSRVYPSYKFPPNTGYSVAASRLQTRTALESLGLPRAPVWYARRPGADTLLLFFGTKWPRKFWADVELRDAAPCGTLLTLLKTSGTRPDEDLASLKDTFSTDVIVPLRSQFTSCLRLSPEEPANCASTGRRLTST